MKMGRTSMKISVNNVGSLDITKEVAMDNCLLKLVLGKNYNQACNQIHNLEQLRGKKKLPSITFQLQTRKYENKLSKS